MQICQDRLALLMKQSDAAQTYSLVVTTWIEATKAGEENRRKLAFLRAAAEEARMAAIDARDRLDRHIARHHCQSPDGFS
jgi:hypothetical protein